MMDFKIKATDVMDSEWVKIYSLQATGVFDAFKRLDKKLEEIEPTRTVTMKSVK